MATFLLPKSDSALGGGCDFNANFGQLGKTIFITTGSSFSQTDPGAQGEYFYRYVIDASANISFTLEQIGTVKVGYGCFVFNISSTSDITILEGQGLTTLVNLPPQTIVLISAKESGLFSDIWEVIGITYGVFANFVYVDDVFGNDTTGVPNVPNRAFATIDAAALASSPDDVILVRPGNYALSTNINSNDFNYFFAPGAVVNCDSGSFIGSYSVFGSGEFDTTTGVNFGGEIAVLEAERITGGFFNSTGTGSVFVSVNNVNGSFGATAFQFDNTGIGDITRIIVKFKNVLLTTTTDLIACASVYTPQIIEIDIESVVSTSSARINLQNNGGKIISINGSYYENFIINCTSVDDIFINVETFLNLTLSTAINIQGGTIGQGDIFINNYKASGSATGNIDIDVLKNFAININNIETNSRILSLINATELDFEFYSIFSGSTGTLFENIDASVNSATLIIKGNYVDLGAPFVVNSIANITLVEVNRLLRSFAILSTPLFANNDTGIMRIKGTFVDYGSGSLFLSNSVNGTMDCEFERIVGGDNGLSSACVIDGDFSMKFGQYIKTGALSAFETTDASELNIIGNKISNVGALGEAVLLITGTGSSIIYFSVNDADCTDGNILLSERDSGSLDISVFCNRAEVGNASRVVISLNRPVATTTYNKFLFGGRFVSAGADVISLEPSATQFILSRASLIGGGNSINYTGAGTQTVQNQGETVATNVAVGTTNLGTFTVNPLFT